MASFSPVDFSAGEILSNLWKLWNNFSRPPHAVVLLCFANVNDEIIFQWIFSGGYDDISSLVKMSLKEATHLKSFLVNITLVTLRGA